MGQWEATKNPVNGEVREVLANTMQGIKPVEATPVGLPIRKGEEAGVWPDPGKFTGKQRLGLAKKVFGAPVPHKWGCSYVRGCDVDLSITYGSLGQMSCEPTWIYKASHKLTMTFRDERKTHYGPSGQAAEEVAFRPPRAGKRYRTEPCNSRETRDRGRIFRALDSKKKAKLEEKTAEYFGL